ncbi:MAG: hypothetical protein KGH73_08120 [Xanthomonadaceae bacterium]|nr:hypothetical protein [Xanthomonadaceae bacterium]MDE2246355.1 hypothetical protein [Xanthomonadaceae bacterium]
MLRLRRFHRALPWVVALAAGLIAAWLRYRLVEPAALAQACAAGAGGVRCALRAATVVAFHSHGLTMVCGALAAMALIARERRIAALTLAAGAAGLVLYSFEAGAAAVLAGALVLARPVPRSDGAGTPEA